MLINGLKIAEELNLVSLREISRREKTPKFLNGAKLRLAAVLIGNHAESRKFLELKNIAARKLGIDFRLYEFPETITTQKLRKEIVAISKTSTNDGVIIELPLPKHINTQYILNAVLPEKDPDVLSEKAQGTFFANRSTILPPSVEAVKQIFQHFDINPKRKTCAVFGYGILVGKPIAHWLASQNATVSIINEFTPNPKQIAANADIIISGVGQNNLITVDMVKDGVIIIDFARDVDFENVSKKASLITPPIGGVGPIVIASVLNNLVKLKISTSKN
jgi:methylenetetrahydrofolate dehydrogenase (NADP+) / methenyltetrahydrofolate cyclohydrolase